jgi:hypothetical protein
MTNEKFLEEILHESYKLGIYEEVTKLSEKFKDLDTIDRYQMAFNQVKSELNIPADN